MFKSLDLSRLFVICLHIDLHLALVISPILYFLSGHSSLTSLHLTKIMTNFSQHFYEHGFFSCLYAYSHMDVVLAYIALVEKHFLERGLGLVVGHEKITREAQI